MPSDCMMMEERAGCSENVTVWGNTWIWSWPRCSLHSEHLHTFYVILSLPEKIMAGCCRIRYPGTHSACRSGTHRQKSRPFPLRLRGGNQGKWGMPSAPTSLIAGWRGLGMKECQVTVGHVVLCNGAVCISTLLLWTDLMLCIRDFWFYRNLRDFTYSKSFGCNNIFLLHFPSIFMVLSRYINKIKCACKAKSMCRTTENIFNRRGKKCPPLI